MIQCKGAISKECAIVGEGLQLDRLAVPLKTLCEIAEEFWTSARRDLWRTFGRGGNNFNHCCRDHGHGDFI